MRVVSLGQLFSILSVCSLLASVISVAPSVSKDKSESKIDAAIKAHAEKASAKSDSANTVLAEWTDTKRSRKIPIKFYFPKSQTGPFPVVIFSHGLGGSREAASYLGEYWASKGYLGVFIQHEGSDTSVWKSSVGNRAAAMAKMKAAANGKNLVDRAEDVKFILDELERQCNTDLLKGKLDLSKVAVSGHSFGAGTSLAVAGQNFGLMKKDPKFLDKRIKAAIYLCPPVGVLGKRNPQRGYGTIQIPGMLLTGTEDNSPIGNTSAADRRIPFDGIAAPHQYLVNFNGADHATFGGRSFRQEKSTDAKFHKSISELTGRFLDAALKNDAAAWNWLDKGAAASYLGSTASYEHK